jgi:flagellar biogenesis protein FliO
MAINWDSNDTSNKKNQEIGALIFVLVLIGFMFFMFKRLTKRKR